MFSAIVFVDHRIDGFGPLRQVCRIVADCADVLQHELQCGAILLAGLAVTLNLLFDRLRVKFA